MQSWRAPTRLLCMWPLEGMVEGCVCEGFVFNFLLSESQTVPTWSHKILHSNLSKIENAGSAVTLLMGSLHEPSQLYFGSKDNG